jgi:hypothetical protein
LQFFWRDGDATAGGFLADQLLIHHLIQHVIGYGLALGERILYFLDLVLPLGDELLTKLGGLIEKTQLLGNLIDLIDLQQAIKAHPRLQVGDRDHCAVDSDGRDGFEGFFGTPGRCRVRCLGLV